MRGATELPALPRERRIGTGEMALSGDEAKMHKGEPKTKLKLDHKAS